MRFLKDAYTSVVNKVRNELGFEKLPIIIHGYDYAIPYPCAGHDPRNPIHAAKNEWLGEPLDKRNIKDPTLRHNIIKYMIDRLYKMMVEISG